MSSGGDQAVEETTMDDGVETSITDEIDSDLDLVAKKQEGNGILPFIEQDN